MKMTNFFKMALMGIFAAGVFTACGGDDDNPNPNPNPGGGDDPKTAPTITLTGAHAQECRVGQIPHGTDLGTQ